VHNFVFLFVHGGLVGTDPESVDVGVYIIYFLKNMYIMYILQYLERYCSIYHVY